MLITMGLQVVTRGLIMAIWAIGKILGHSEYWLWAVLVAVIVNVFNDDCFDDASLSKTVLDSGGWQINWNSITRESLTGIRVVRAYNAEEYQNEKICISKWWIDTLEFVCQPSYGYFEPYHDGDFKWFECGDLLDWGLCD